MALGEFLHTLETRGELHRTRVEIDPHLELTEVARRAILEGKPALLVERPANSPYPLCINHFADKRRIGIALRRDPDEIGSELINFLERVFPLTLRNILDQKPVIRRFLHAPARRVGRGISQEVVEPPDLDSLPVQFCWPADGGRFITYGQVLTYDPRDGRRNIGIYRMQVFDSRTTGMHWQIQKGGGFHYYQSEASNSRFEVAVALGTDPALVLATVAALPEGLDEALFAGFLQGERVRFTRGVSVGIDVPASAEFILEGIVPAKERRTEGPFGDHFGHYSAAAEFPVFHLTMMTRRHRPVYPAIVVGKPPMEDKFLGDATQQMLGPLIRLIHKEVRSLWAYYEAGFHNLLAVGIEQRYQKEAMKAALGLMGTDQLSLTKCMITVSAGVDVRDWHALLREVRMNFDPHFDFVMIPRVPLDTLDFTSYKMNLGSKMILDATRKPWRNQTASGSGPAAPVCDPAGIRRIDARIDAAALIDDTLLIVRLSATAGEGAGRQIMETLVRHPETAGVPIAAVVSHDVDLSHQEQYIWGIFTRFDCERDVLFRETALVGITPVYRGTMGIDATWKPGYPDPLTMPEEIVRRVDEKWGRIWKQ